MNNFIDIYISERKKPVLAFCEICNGVLQTQEDATCAYNNGGCSDCFVSFLEPNRSIDGKSWEPSEEEVKAWLLRKKAHFKPMYKFF